MAAPETFTTVFKAILDEGAPSRHGRYLRTPAIQSGAKRLAMLGHGERN